MVKCNALEGCKEKIEEKESLTNDEPLIFEYTTTPGV